MEGRGFWPGDITLYCGGLLFYCVFKALTKGKRMRKRNSSRAVMLNTKNEIFLIRYFFDYFKDKNTVWLTPGGGLEDGETYEEALKREVFEETGVRLDGKYRYLFFRDRIYTLSDGEKVLGHEQYYLVRIGKEAFSFENWTKSEQKRMSDPKWWSKREISESGDEFFSDDIIDIMDKITEDRLPDYPVEIY